MKRVGWPKFNVGSLGIDNEDGSEYVRSRILYHIGSHQSSGSVISGDGDCAGNAKQ